ncbi:phenylacetate--CoA ligase family protein [Sneathiella sp. P13V-1]|uniref:phenylacetate--CoA ligase family protein n=1 Tax=Sneathiella sp. P13V-1 TaxID=2697366 RepID=UPI00187B7ED7|nr:phenylacetate--CoA ligase family protein [Sneathiella sp. P13V-1]MBE7637485.1 phenylacetate--CoA ligase family protein [Sneathiella sp. P13V-1]
MAEFGMTYRRPDFKSKIGASCWHDVEHSSHVDISHLQEEKLRRQLKYLEENSEFYRRKFTEAGIKFEDIQTLKDLQKVPFTYKTEIRDSLSEAPPFGHHRAADMSDIIQMQASSGTTGSPSYVAMTENDVVMWNEMSARCLFAGGIRPNDLVLHGFSLAKGFVGGVPLTQAVQYMGAVDVPIGADGGVDRLLRAIVDLKPRAIIGAPNFILHLAEKAPELVGCKASDLGIERLIVGGEPGGGIPAFRRKLEELWGAKCCELLGGTDLGVTYWSECDDQSGMHMLCPDYIITELYDEASDSIIPFEKGAEGELIYTAIGREASPLMRFRSGDHIEVLGTDCACGRTGPKIRCTGRTDDMLIVRGANVFPSAIQSIIGDMTPETNGVMRVFADFEGHTTQGNLKVIVERGADQPAEKDPILKSEIETRLRNALVFRAEVILVPADSFDKPGAAKVALTLREKPEFL